MAITTPEFPEKKHLYSVDYIRAFASLAVAVFHLGGKVLPVLKFGWLGVEMFFVLSGFIICLSIPPFYTLKNSGTFILKRLTRIEPPYIISLLLLLVLNWSTTHNYQPDWRNVLFHLAYLNNFFNSPYLNPVYWTLGLEFQYYIFIAFAFPFVSRKYGIWLVLALATLPLYISFGGQVLPSVFVFFALGIISWLYFSGRLSKIKFFVSITAVSVIGFFINGWMPLAAGLLAVLIILAPLKKNNIVSFFSKISFSLYLTHDIVGSRLVVFLGTKFPKTVLYKGSIFLTGIAVSIIFAWLYYLIIEKPFFRLSKSINYRRSGLQKELQIN